MASLNLVKNTNADSNEFAPSLKEADAILADGLADPVESEVEAVAIA